MSNYIFLSIKQYYFYSMWQTKYSSIYDTRGQQSTSNVIIIAAVSSVIYTFSLLIQDIIPSDHSQIKPCLNQYGLYQQVQLKAAFPRKKTNKM